MGGNSPHGKDEIYIDDITNGNYFRNLKAQSWWNLRKKLENTIKLLDGEKIDISTCLILDKNIKKLDSLIIELSQASYEHDESKLKVNKQPNGSDSPNLADAVVMAFSRSIKNGLKAR